MNRDASDRLPEELELASLWRRATAVLINVLVGAGGLGVVGSAVFASHKLGLAPGRLLRPLGRRLEDRIDRPRAAPTFSWRTRMPLDVPGLALQLDGRNRRALGARLMDMRRVDLATGGSISLKSALIRYWGCW